MKRLVPKIPAIAVTGSAGKSTTTAFIYAILKTRWKHIIKTKKNLNLPKHTKKLVKQIKPHHRAAIIEMGFGRDPGGKHFHHIQPNIGVITNIGSAHYGKLGNSVQSIADAKSLLIKHLHPNGTMLLNNDDENSKLINRHNFKGELFTVGINNNATYRARSVKYLNNGMSFTVKLKNRDEPFFIPTFGMHNVINALFAIGIAHRIGFSAQDIRKGLRKFKTPYRRLEVVQLPKQSLLIDDTFNANPHSVKAAIDVLKNLASSKKKIVVLGSMLELGSHSKKGHKEVGRYLVNKQIHSIFTYGKKAKLIGTTAVKKGFSKGRVHHFTSRSELHKKLKQEIGSNRAILVKGSHKMNMKETAEYIARVSLRG